MKKIFLGLLSLVLCMAICGCTNTSTSSAISSLSSQLDETANTISSVETVNPTSLGTSSNNLSSTQNALMREEWNKAQILSRTAEIKNQLDEDASLSKEELSAIKELTSSLNKYTLSVAYTKNDLDSTVKSISSLSKNEEKNADKLDAKLNRLTCSSNARATYYENILNTLDQIDAYLSSAEESAENEADESNQNEENYVQPSVPFGQNYGYNSNNINRAAYGMGYGGYGAYGGYGGYGMGGNFGGVNTFNMPMTGGYAENIGGMTGTPFNLNRNTDTYAPMVRNVDTYRPFEPEKRIEEFEEVGEDNTLQEADGATETSVKPRPAREHHIAEESENFEQSENSNFGKENFRPHRMKHQDRRGEDLETEQTDAEILKFAPHHGRKGLPADAKPDEKKPDDIQHIEPQAKVREENAEPLSESKIKSVSAETTQNEHEDWDLPIEAH